MEQRLVSGPPAGQFNEASSGVRATAICGIRGIRGSGGAERGSGISGTPNTNSRGEAAVW